MAFWSKRTEPPRDKLGYLRRFGTAELELFPGVPDGVELPAAWQALLASAPSARPAAAMDMWNAAVAQDLRNTITYLSQRLTEVELLRVDDDYFLLYTVSNDNGDPRYYVGGNPIAADFGPNAALKAQWNRVPASLRVFYEKLHDGFYEYSSGSCGLDSRRQVLLMNSLEWGVIEQRGLALEIDLSTSYAFFNNGAGGYVVLDLARSDEAKATLWWADDSPRYGMNFWDLVDEWIAIGFSG